MIVIAGAGVIGSAIAYAYRDSDQDIVVLDKATFPGSGISSRNSGVIHAGLYYPRNSLKDRLCRQGREMLYRFCEAHHVAHRKIGKLIVAQTGEEEDLLLKLKEDVAEDVPLCFTESFSPAIAAKKALFSPESGIIDVHGFIMAMLSASGAEVLPGQQVQWVKRKGDRVEFQVNDEIEECALFINACGLDSFQLFGSVLFRPYAKGSYFRITRKPPAAIESLVYPVVPKASPSLGTHLTLDLQGSLLLGPNLNWVDDLDYHVDEADRDDFHAAALRYLPWLEAEDLEPGYVGYRPKIAGPAFRDFLFHRDGPVLHCLGIESPGITAALAIGEHVRKTLEEAS